MVEGKAHMSLPFFCALVTNARMVKLLTAKEYKNGEFYPQIAQTLKPWMARSARPDGSAKHIPKKVECINTDILIELPISSLSVSKSQSISKFL
jgi:hypothetical protein